MPYKLNPEQFESVLALSSADRYSHFVGKVADWQQLWGVKNGEGWLFPIIDGEFEYFPVWPHPEYAQKMSDLHFPGHSATEISLEQFLNEWLPDFEKDGVKVGVFPNKEWSIWVMEPSDLAECLRDEMSLDE
ncbi:MAG: DUF2750 domain-containing protein [Kangiellaceae bacterium]|nr:DUF2750 domain-containing protein [Kangiellaceae bacterium]MCW8997213.1 DUF2750 domain-containing protein [Kangiellaceae bacterium]MCW9017196.1 DUF2750 domain-containing protein [Kangiellaceae bacterium]